MAGFFERVTDENVLKSTVGMDAHYAYTEAAE